MNTILTKLTRNSWHDIRQRTQVVMVAELVDQTVNPHLQWAGKELLRFVFKRQLQISFLFVTEKILYSITVRPDKEARPNFKFSYLFSAHSYFTRLNLKKWGCSNFARNS